MTVATYLSLSLVLGWLALLIGWIVSMCRAASRGDRGIR